MLSLREDDDDDSHLCIKCNATILGLDNYIKHRKERCKKPEDPKPDLPIDTLEPSYSLGADVFFQSLELQSSVKKTSLSRLTPPILPKTNLERKSLGPSTSRDLTRISPVNNNLRGEDWIGGHSLRIGSNEDNQTKLINAVASISGAVKKDIPTSSYNINYDYKGDEDSEDSEESEDDDEDDHPSASKWKPPHNYTGGKWPPASPDHEEWELREEQEHTGGKWKLMIQDANDREDDYDAPPPGYTKGKWVPGANEKTQIMQTTIQTKGSVQYWCGPCNRRLGSRTIYDKHLRSSLHLKKVLPEHELEFSGHLELKNVLEKRLPRSSKLVNDEMYLQEGKKKKRKLKSKLNVKIEKKKRKRKPNFVNCAGCKSRVRQHLMGKHLISHYHFRKTNDTNSAVYRQLILDNIDAVVHQSPFQCSPCKFYTNWLSTFMQHWFSEEHEQKLTTIEGRLWCSFCKFECETSQDMLQHMAGQDHSEVVAVINRSMPIIIRKKTVLKCETCNKEFRYNVEMKRHSKETKHLLPKTATDNYQEFHECVHCKVKFKSSLTLAAHLKSKHKQRAHLCLVCELSFDSSEDAKRHRQTSEHRVRRQENKRQQGVPVKDISKKCPYCTEKVLLNNILDLKEHIRVVHPNIRKTCPKCGMSFILSQEVSRHIRDKACQFQMIPQSSSIFWSCSQCVFTTNSQAECFFHEVLHTTPTKELRKVADVEKTVDKYQCPLCPRKFTKPSLRHHLRLHTFERPFVCSNCSANFTRLTSLANHLKMEHGTDAPKVPKLPPNLKREDWECERCKKRFSSNSALTRHTSSCGKVTTSRKCPHDQCTFVATNNRQLIRHRRSHEADFLGEHTKLHKCQLCSFKTDQASHLKRHLICHKGIKPYGCPHCQFTCGSLENLRKHVLRSGRHPGLSLYHCRLCPYITNTATELRNHLTTAHAHKYDAKSAVQAVKEHLLVDKKQ